MLGDFFFTLTPICLTTSGRTGVARATRFCTSTWAVLTSVPIAKVTVRLYPPSLVDCDDMYSMFSTPLTCCSTGAATVSATTRALAPGYEQLTCTVGGVMSGYWAIGRTSAASPPSRTMMIEMTQAKIGRSMKKRASIEPVPFRRNKRSCERSSPTHPSSPGPRRRAGRAAGRLRSHGRSARAPVR